MPVKKNIEKGGFGFRNFRVYEKGRRGTPRAVVSATVETHGASANVEAAKVTLGIPGVDHRGIPRAVGSTSVEPHGVSAKRGIRNHAFL